MHYCEQYADEAKNDRHNLKACVSSLREHCYLFVTYAACWIDASSKQRTPETRSQWGNKDPDKVEPTMLYSPCHAAKQVKEQSEEGEGQGRRDKGEGGRGGGGGGGRGGEGGEGREWT